MNGSTRESYLQVANLNGERCSKDVYESITDENCKYKVTYNNIENYYKMKEPVSYEDMVVQVMASTNRNVKTIKNISVFMFILTIINIITTIILCI